MIAIDKTTSIKNALIWVIMLICSLTLCLAMIVSATQDVKLQRKKLVSQLEAHGMVTLCEHRDVTPAVSSTGAVSPMPRATPRMTAVMPTAPKPRPWIRTNNNTPASPPDKGSTMPSSPACTRMVEQGRYLSFWKSCLRDHVSFFFFETTRCDCRRSDTNP